MTPRPPAARVWTDDEIIVDSFAGGGGASKGIEMALGRSPDIAINHDAEAIAMHRANHPETEHFNESVWTVDPVEACRGRRVGLMWLSPDCTDFSKAKGGKPISRKRRALAFVAVRWARTVKPRVIVLENVEEFEGWGPLLKNDKRDPARIGHTFKIFVGRLRGLGYRVEWKQLRACDFGAPTTRRRLFLIARCDGQPIVWPTPTHGPGRPLPWRTAAECIDWHLPCPSIFMTPAEAKAYYKATGKRVKRPLEEPTLARIGRGVWRYVINAAEPFIIPIDNQSNGERGATSVRAPLGTIVTENRHAVVTPYLVNAAHGEESESGKRWGKGAHSVADPLGTIAQTNDFALVAPTLVQMGYGERDGQKPRCLDIQKPLGTVVEGRKHALVAAFLAKHNGGHEATGQTLFEPAPTIVQEQLALVSSCLVHLRGSEESHLHGDPVTEPLRVVSAGGNHAAQVQAFLVAYYGNEQDGQDLFSPMRTVTAKERMALVVVHGQNYLIVDLGMRMLTPRERFRAQGFPDDYIIDVLFEYAYYWKKGPRKGQLIRRVTKPLTEEAQGRMCGNSVSPYQAKAIVAANCPELVRQEVAA